MKQQINKKNLILYGSLGFGDDILLSRTASKAHEMYIGVYQKMFDMSGEVTYFSCSQANRNTFARIEDKQLLQK